MLTDSQEAWQNITENTLVIIVDTHINSRVESVDVLNKASKVVVFDHHRKSTDFIDKAVMVYHEPYASSACELVTEMIQYIGEKVKLKSAEADALLAGMTVDTQNFSMKTGTITFEAAAFLKRCGADGIRVRKLLQEDLDVFKARAMACLLYTSRLFHGVFRLLSLPSHRQRLFHLCFRQQQNPKSDLHRLLYT